MFRGNLTALVTPFRDNIFDEEAYTRFVEWQVREGVHGLVPCGTTGESVALSEEEFQRAIEICVSVAKGKIPVIAGSGCNTTEKTIKLSRIATKAGADGLLIVTPYYNKPTQDGLYAHYKAVHDATDLPIVLYDVPGRAVVEIGVPVMQKLSRLPRIVGVKDATQSLHKPLQIARMCGENFCQLSGDDGTSLAHLIQGGHGCISVISNIAPRMCSEMHEAWMKEDIQRAQQINLALQPLREALFCETSPSPVKYGTELLGFGSSQVRLPLVPASPSAREQVSGQMRELGLIS